MRSPSSASGLLLLALPLLLTPAWGCILFADDPCAEGTEQGCAEPAAQPPPPTKVPCNQEFDERCLRGTSCRFDLEVPGVPGVPRPLYCLPELEERPTCTRQNPDSCRRGGGGECDTGDDCKSGVCVVPEVGHPICLQLCHSNGGGEQGSCDVNFVCEPGVELAIGGTVDACSGDGGGGGPTVRCSSDRSCEELGLGRCVVKNGLQIKDGLAVAICSDEAGEDDTGQNCSHPDGFHPVFHSDLCPVRGLCFRSCRNNDSEGCNEGICTRPCQRDSDCPDRLFCLPFDAGDIVDFFPGNAAQFKVCRLQDSNGDYEWGCKDDVDCCSGLHTTTLPWGPADPPPPDATFPIQFGFSSSDPEELRCCLKTSENICQPYPAPYSLESHCSLVSIGGGPADQPPPRLSTECLSNHQRLPPLALPGDPCTDGNECLTHLCTGGRCTTPCYTEPWPNSPDRDPTCPALPDGTARVCCPGRVPLFDPDGVGRTCAGGETCPAGSVCQDGSCQLCIATCQLGDACPAGSDPTCTGPL